MSNLCNNKFDYLLCTTVYVLNVVCFVTANREDIAQVEMENLKG